MNGTKYLLDTNAVIYLLNGQIDITEKLAKANWIGISIITYIEFFAFDNLSDNDKKLFAKFLSRIDTIDINIENDDLINKVIDISPDSSRIGKKPQI